MKTKLLTAITIIFAMATNAQAWTFVGNGGNAGDIELQVAINQIQATLKQVERFKDHPDLKLCTCYERYKEQPICNNLKRLAPTQVQYCAAVLKQHTPEILALLNDNQSIRFSWTPQQIDVVEGQGLRGADAVTDAATRTVTLNQQNFIAMSPSERMFLVAHELFHLTKLDGDFMSDERAYSEFSGYQGGRQLINAMASSLVIESYDQGSFDLHGKELSRSQNVKRNWFNLGYDSISTPTEDKNAYESRGQSAYRLGYRHQFNEWGVLAEYAHAETEKSILTSTKVKETRDTLALGVSYRWFPFSEPLTFTGQSHFVFSAKWVSTQGTLKADDGFTALEDTNSASGFGLGASYFIPLTSGFWGYANLEYVTPKINFSKFNLNYNSHITSIGIGAAYAF